MILESKLQDVVLIGYSGHGFVVVDSLLSNGGTIKGYCETVEKDINPFNLQYLGNDEEQLINGKNWFIAIGNNVIRGQVYSKYQHMGNLIVVKHSTSYVGYKCIIKEGTLLSANAVVNPLSSIGKCCIINTGAIVEHECKVGDFTHIAPGVVLAGNVFIGNNTFVGANSVIKQGVKIGDNVIIGAGAVVLKDVPNDVTVIGNPAKKYSM